MLLTNEKPSLKAYLSQIWRYRELLCFFVLRDITIRYKQALLGIAWVLLRPMLTVLLFTFVFSTVARFPSSAVNYPLFVLAGMLPWQLFASCLIDSCATISNHAALISKAYFPRILLPITTGLVQSIDFGVNLLLFSLLSLYFGQPLTFFGLFMLPFVIAWTLLLCWGCSFWLAPLAGIYHDIRFLIAFAVQLGVFISPVGYATFLVPQKWLFCYSLNPLVGLIDAYRTILLGGYHPDQLFTMLASFMISILLFTSGIYFNKQIEGDLVDLI